MIHPAPHIIQHRLQGERRLRTAAGYAASVLKANYNYSRLGSVEHPKYVWL